jgi:hypothetical protein
VKKRTLCLCEPDADTLCDPCTIAMLEAVKPAKRDLIGAWDGIKASVWLTWLDDEKRDAVLVKICEHYTGPGTKKTGTWLFLGVAPDKMTVWLYNNKIFFQGPNYRKFLIRHKMPYTM